jgi:hypothetical protein
MPNLPVIIKGTKVALTPQQRENVPTYWKWICDPAVNAGLTDIGACVSIETNTGGMTTTLPRPPGAA